MTTTLELHLPDELAEAIVAEYEARRSNLTESMEAHGWSRQAKMVEEMTDTDTDAENRVAMAAIALLAAESDYSPGEN